MRAIEAQQADFSGVAQTLSVIDERLNSIDKMQSQLESFEERLSQIEKVTQDTLSILHQVKLKKKKKGKGKKNKK